MTDDAYTRPPDATGDGYKRGPMGTHDTGRYALCAIGFCPWCGTNARRTTAIRGLFNCPHCSHYWHDDRVGSQTRTFDDFFSDT
jgi:hypothetical protein